jgi:hypothetical protein
VGGHRVTSPVVNVVINPVISTASGTVTKGLDILTQIPQGGTANGTSDGALARPIRFESITVTPR